MLIEDAIGTLGETGVRLSLDDFGTGYSSLGRVAAVRFDQLKIDRSFVSALPDPRSLAVVGSMVTLARGLGMDVVAEGVETQQMRRMVLDLGVDLLQGYLIERPVPAEQLRTWLS